MTGRNHGNSQNRAGKKKKRKRRIKKAEDDNFLLKGKKNLVLSLNWEIIRIFAGDKGTYGLHSARRGRKSGLALKMAVAFNGDSSPTAVFSALFSKIVSNRIYMETEMTRKGFDSRTITPAMRRAIKKARREYAEGKTISCSTPEEMQRYFDSL